MSASTVAMIRPPGGQGFRADENDSEGRAMRGGGLMNAKGSLQDAGGESIRRKGMKKKPRPSGEKKPSASVGMGVPRGEGKRPTGPVKKITRESPNAKSAPKDPMAEISGGSASPTKKKSIDNYNKGVY